VCGNGILRYKYGIFNWEYVTEEVGTLYFGMAEEIFVVRGY